MDLTKMHKLIEGLRDKPQIQVGFFEGPKAQRKDGLTNAALASYHEYGAPEHGLPPRSILRTPLADHAAEIMAPFKGNAKALLAQGSLVQMYKLIGIAAEKVVVHGFDTGGYGKWAALKHATIWRKLKGSVATKVNKYWNVLAGNTGMGILIATGQLRRAVSSRVRMKF